MLCDQMKAATLMGEVEQTIVASHGRSMAHGRSS